MSSQLPPVPHMIPMYDIGGYLNPVWADWFQKVFLRVGGTTAETNDELFTIGSERLADGSITEAKLSASVAGQGLTGGAGVPLAVNPDGTTLENNSDQVRIKDLGVSTAKLADGAVSFLKQLATDWTKSLAVSGYQKLPSGLYVQWGVTASLASGSTTTITFPTAFPSGCLQAFPLVRDNSAVATTSTGQPGSGNYSTTGFDLYNRTSVALVFNWMAVGY